jgi:hypothetical protein
VGDIMAVREDFFGISETRALRAGVNRYSVPKRAIGGGVKVLTLVDSSGSESAPLTRIDGSRRYEFSGSSGQPSAVEFEGDECVVYPTPPDATCSLKFQYYQRPNRLISTEDCAKITAVADGVTNVTFTVDTDLTADLVTGDQVDIVSAKAPFLLWGSELPIVAISSTQFQIARSGIVDQASVVEPVVGDYICPTGYSNIPMLPEVFHPVLAQYISNRLLEALGDLNKLAAGEARAQKMITKAIHMVKNRMESSPIRAVRRNGLGATFGG